MTAATAPAQPSETLESLIHYLDGAGVALTRLSLASLATDRGLTDKHGRELLKEFDARERHERLSA